MDYSAALTAAVHCRPVSTSQEPSMRNWHADSSSQRHTSAGLRYSKADYELLAEIIQTSQSFSRRLHLNADSEVILEWNFRFTFTKVDPQ